MSEQAAERVARGAAWLDDVAPGWERKIDLSTLDILDPCLCVCGQVAPLGLLAGNWGRGENGYHSVSAYAERQFGGGADRWLILHGFADVEDTETWVALIKERFDSGALSDEVDA